MRKFVELYAKEVAGIEIYPLISLCIFFAFFIALLVYVVRMSKKKIEWMRQINKTLIAWNK